MRAMRRDAIGRIAGRFEQYGDLYYAPFLGRDVYVLRHPDHIRQVLIEQAAKFQKPEQGLTARELKKLLGNGLLNSNGDAWRKQRRRVQPAFGREQLEAYGAHSVRFAREALTRFDSGLELDVGREMMDLTLRVVAKSLFDHEIETESDEVAQAMRAFRDTFGGIDAVLPSWLPTAGRRRTSKALASIDAIVYRWIDARRSKPTGGADLLSLLAQVRAGEEPMERAVLRDELLTLFIAGHETTSHALSWTWALLAQHPQIEARLHEELDQVLAGREPEVKDLPKLVYTERVLSEAMRLYPPAYAIARVATVDVTVGSFVIPEGADVVIWIYHVHHDARWFADPERFDPDRFSPERKAALPACAYLPFGAGTRICIGKQFAMMEAQLILATLAQQVRLTRDNQQPVAKHLAVTLAPRALKMRVLRRTAS